LYYILLLSGASFGGIAEIYAQIQEAVNATERVLVLKKLRRI
jgi:hypothetical protein